MFNRISSSRRKVYRNQLFIVGIIVASWLMYQFALPFLSIVCILLPTLTCLAILHYASTDLLPRSKDGTLRDGLMIVNNPGTRNARTHVIYHNSILISDNPTRADLLLEKINNVNASVEENKRSCIIYQREDNTWWIRNTGRREITVNTQGNQITLPGKEQPAPADQRECEVQVGSRCTFYTKLQEMYSVIEFRGIFRSTTTTAPVSLQTLMQASVAHYRYVIMAVLSVVLSTWCLLYATESGIYTSATTLRPLQSSLAAWQSIAIYFFITALFLTVIFIVVDMIMLYRGYTTPQSAPRRPKRMFLALFMVLMMAGTVVSFRTEGRILGSTHIQLITNDSQLQASYRSKLKQCFTDPQRTFADVILTPADAQTAECQNQLTNVLTSKKQRNAPGNTNETLRLTALLLFVMMGGVLLLLITLHTYTPNRDVLHSIRQQIYELWKRRIPAWLNEWIANIVLFVTAVLAAIYREPNNQTTAFNIFGVSIPVELFRFAFLVAMIWVVAYQVQLREDTNNTSPQTTPLALTFTQQVIAWGRSYIGRAVISCVLLVSVAALTKDFGPFLAYGMLFFFIASLYSTRRWWMISGIVALLLFIVSINIWRTDIAGNTMLREHVINHAGTSMKSWFIRPSDPQVQKDIRALLQPLVTESLPYEKVYNTWYTRSTEEDPPRCVDYVDDANICTTDASMRQSLYAIINGGMVGMGAGLGLSNPPDPFSPPLVENIHNDFVFVVIFEEYGLTGGVVILMIFYLITANLLVASQRIKSRIGQVIAASVGLWWSVQVLLVISGNLRFLPFAGINTPFISNGTANIYLTAFAVGVTLWVSTMPYHPINEIKRWHAFNFRALQLMMTFGSIVLLGFVVLMQTGLVINTDLYKQVQSINQIVPRTPEYTSLSYDWKLGRRLDCLFVRRPVIATIEDANGRTLVAIDKEINGCRSRKMNFEPAQKFGRSLHDFLKEYIYKPDYQRELYYPNKDLRNQPLPITLTLDGQMQRDIELLFDNSTDSANRTISGQVVVIGYDGGIRAFVNRYHVVDASDPMSNELAGGARDMMQGMFVPGSVWKPFMASAALAQGMQASDEIPCNLGAQIIGFDRAVRNSFGALNCVYAAGSDTQGTNFSYALSYSVNTFFTGLTDASLASVPGQMPGNLPLNRDDVLTHLEAFGITKFTQSALWNGWSLPGAQSASVAGFSSSGDFDNTYAPDFGLAAMGQGSALTSPLALAAAMQVIANNGVAHTIHLVQGDTQTVWNNQQRITPEQATILQGILFDSVRIAYEKPVVISDATFRLAGAAAVLDDTQQHLVAGKTGTAEIQDGVNPFCANTSDARCPPLSWFVGFSPKAQAIVVVMLRAHDIDAPSPCSAAGIAGSIFDYLLKQPNPVPCIERGR